MGFYQSYSATFLQARDEADMNLGRGFADDEALRARFLCGAILDENVKSMQERRVFLL